MLPKRKMLPHETPFRVGRNSPYFITICAQRRGINQLCDNVVAHRLWESVLYRQSLGQWWPRLFLLMPDHLHMIVYFSTEVELKKTVTSWKRYTASQFGVSWQQGFFDHRIRDQKFLIQKMEYIRLNPVRAGLVESPEDWPFCWEVEVE